MSRTTEQEKMNIDLARMKYLVIEIEKLRKRKAKYGKIIIFLVIVIVVIELLLFVADETLRTIISALIAPILLGLIFAYFNSDEMRLNEIIERTNELHQIGRNYYFGDFDNELLKVIEEYKKTTISTIEKG